MEAAYGGVLLEAHISDGVLSDRTRGHVGIPVVGGAAWEGEPPHCHGVVKVTNLPCGAPPVKGQDYCAGHRRSQEKNKKGT